MLLLGSLDLCVRTLSCCSSSIIALKLQLSLCRVCLCWFSLSNLSLHTIGLGCVCLSTSTSKTLVELYQIWLYLLVVICLPELQVGTTLQELTHTLWFTNTRHLHHDTSLLSFQFLDVWLNNSELINTVAYHIEGIVNSSLYLFAQHTLHLVVRTLCAHFALQLLCSEDCCKLTAI